MFADTGQGKPEVFAFTDYRSYLNAYYRDKKTETGTFSVRSWCKRMSVKSPATLNMILRGHRHPGDEVLEKLIKYFKFSNSEREYFDQLVRLAKHKGSDERKIDILMRLRDLHPEKNLEFVDFDRFEVISNWYFMVIREITLRADFTEDPEKIAELLRNRVSADEVKDALAIMQRIRLLTRDETGRLRVSQEQISTPNDFPNEAVKRFHEQMLDWAKKSIRDVPVEDREVSGTTFNVHTKDLPLIKQEVRKMREYIYKSFERSDANATYQINVQLFPLTAKIVDKLDKGEMI